MTSHRWSHLFPILCGVGIATWSAIAYGFQYPPLSDDLNPRQIHGADAWIDGEFRSSGPINSSPADFGPAPGMRQRTDDGNPASGDYFPTMQPGQMPGGMSPQWFNGHPVNGNGFGPNGQMPNQFGPNGQQQQYGPNAQYGSNQYQYGPNNRFGYQGQANAQGMSPQMARAARPQMMQRASDQQPYVGLLGQVAKPGVYEIRSGQSLGELLARCGGPTQDSAGQLRIIRQGRPGQTTSLAAAAQYELVPGDLVIAESSGSQRSDAVRSGESQSAQSGTAARPASSGAVQIGFVNLVDRPVVLKLRSEHASMSAILSVMRQDSALASQVRVVLPSAYSQRFQGQPHPDAPLPSETVLIFPPNSVWAERLAPLPEPIKLDGDKDSDVAAPPSSPPPANRSPNTAQQPSSLGIPSTDADQTIVTEIPPPPPEVTAQDARPSTRRSTTSHTANEIPAVSYNVAADSELVFDDDDMDDSSDEPSLLNAAGKRRPIDSAKEHKADVDTLTASDLEKAEGTANRTASSWSIWPPLLTAGAGLFTLIGFSLLLRRRAQEPTSPAVARQPMGSQFHGNHVRTTSVQAGTVLPQRPNRAKKEPAAIHPAPVTSKHEMLDALINDQLPLTEVPVRFASPLQFHGRPVPPKSLRLDNGHSLPKPHAPGIAPGVTTRTPVQSASGGHQPADASTEAFASTAGTYRVDRSGATAAPKSTASNASGAFRFPHAGSTGGVLDRALSAVQKREERS